MAVKSLKITSSPWKWRSADSR